MRGTYSKRPKSISSLGTATLNLRETLVAFKVPVQEGLVDLFPHERVHTHQSPVTQFGRHQKRGREAKGENPLDELGDWRPKLFANLIFCFVYF
jgi:hypothetical protein